MSQAPMKPQKTNLQLETYDLLLATRKRRFHDR
jgi:hypothetical protein